MSKGPWSAGATVVLAAFTPSIYASVIGADVPVHARAGCSAPAME